MFNYHTCSTGNAIFVPTVPFRRDPCIVASTGECGGERVTEIREPCCDLDIYTSGAVDGRWPAGDRPCDARKSSLRLLCAPFAGGDLRSELSLVSHDPAVLESRLRISVNDAADPNCFSKSGLVENRRNPFGSRPDQECERLPGPAHAAVLRKAGPSAHGESHSSESSWSPMWGLSNDDFDAHRRTLCCSSETLGDSVLRRQLSKPASADSHQHHDCTHAMACCKPHLVSVPACVR
jgi:hypothetical protein